MPENLNALVRYRVIDQCLQRVHLKWTWRELAEACGQELRELGRTDRTPSRRTILGDIQVMRSGMLGYEAPILFDKEKKTYRYTDPDFSINRAPIQQEDIQELQYVLSLLKHFNGLRPVQGLQEIILRLEKAILAGHPRHPNLNYPSIELDRPLTQSAERYITKLLDAIMRRQPLDIWYHPFSEDDPLSFIISPYLLKEYNRRWYLIGEEHKAGQMYHLALDRILELSPSERAFFREPRRLIENYFQHLIGVTFPHSEASAQQVLFRAAPGQDRYLETKPLHPSQRKLKSDEEGTLFSIEVILNYELESELLSFGEQVEVLQPQALRERIYRRLNAARQQYDG